jgi:hypothetical protein
MMFSCRIPINPASSPTASWPSGQPPIEVLSDKFIITQVPIIAADAVDFHRLAGAERFVGIEAPDAFKQSLATEDFMDSGDTAMEIVGGVEQGRVGVGDLIAKPQQILGNRFVVAAV